MQHTQSAAGGVGTEPGFFLEYRISQRGSSLGRSVARRDVETLLEAAGEIGHVFETDRPGYF